MPRWHLLLQKDAFLFGKKHMSFLDSSLQIGKTDSQRPYVPSFAFPEMGEPQVIANPGAMVANGQKPGASNGGLLEINGSIWGSDFAAIESDGDKLRIYPTDKDAIDVPNPETNLGYFTAEGVSILTDFETEEIVINGLVTANRWLAEAKRQLPGYRVTKLANGLSVVQPPMPIRAKLFDIQADGSAQAHLL